MSISIFPLSLRHIPSVLEFFSYIFHFQALMCGPLIFYNDYVDFVEGRNYVKNANPNVSLIMFYKVMIKFNFIIKDFLSHFLKCLKYL